MTVFRRLLAPQQNVCHLCGAFLCAGENTLCMECQSALNRCRIPAFEAASRAYAPARLALSAYAYQAQARALVHRLKFGHDRAAAMPLAHGICAAYAEHAVLFPAPDAVIAVPVHASRLETRGYNQAELLAQAFCRHTRLPFFPDALIRARHDASQVYRSREERLCAMEGAFVAARRFSGLRVLVIDDVLTTGATAMACARCLREAGADEVYLLTACKA